MAKLDVKIISEEKVEYNGAIYEKADYPVQKDDIVKSKESGGDISLDSFYLVKGVDPYEDFRFDDDEDDERDRGINDSDFIPFRKVTELIHPITITLDQPVHLIITNIASIEFKGGKL